MKISGFTRALILGAVGLGFAQDAPPPEANETRVARSRDKTVLVELFTSQGCNYCPTAERLIAGLPERGYGPDRVIPIAFHVDYFNDPWADPFSRRQFSAREWAYSEVAKQRDSQAESLYFTPMVMVDGRYPMSGYHRDGVERIWPFLKARLDRAVRSRAEAALSLALTGSAEAPRRRSLWVEVRAISGKLVGQERLVGVAITEGPRSTEVPSGENAGETLVEHHIVRRFIAEPVTLARSEPAEATFELQLEDDWQPDRCEVVAFLQDEETGFVHQAATISWTTP